MGVKGLWKIVSKCGEEQTPSNMTLAIDTSIWIHQYKGMQKNDVIYNVSKKIIKLLYHKINPVFIFDGPPNPLKRRVLEERKKEKFDSLVKNIINNVICKKCKISIRTCTHGGLLKDDFEEDTLKAHENWGIMQTNGKLKNEEINQIESISKFINSKDYSDVQKLKMLVKMREHRKSRLRVNTSSMTNFSNSQIKNVKNRNLVSFYIKKLENEKAKKIGSDCNREFVFENPDRSKHGNFNTESSSESEINDFLELKNSKNDIKEFDFTNKQKTTNFMETDAVFVCKTESEKLNEGFFGKNENDFVVEKNESDLVEEQNEIEFDFSEGRAIKISSIKEYKNETMDFLSIQSIIKDIIKTFNLPQLDSPSESDAQCGLLCRTGIVDGVITEDNDILLHGGIVYKNFFRKNKNILQFDPKKIEEVMGLSRIDLIDLSFVLGSDYTIGIKGIGMKKAVEYIKTEEFKNMKIERYRNIFLSSSARDDWKPKFQKIEFEKIVKFWKINGLDDERIDELKFYLLTNKK